MPRKGWDKVIGQSHPVKWLRTKWRGSRGEEVTSIWEGSQGLDKLERRRYTSSKRALWFSVDGERMGRRENADVLKAPPETAKSSSELKKLCFGPNYSGRRGGRFGSDRHPWRNASDFIWIQIVAQAQQSAEGLVRGSSVLFRM
jgi:hypothetical protein